MFNLTFRHTLTRVFATGRFVEYFLMLPRYTIITCLELCNLMPKQGLEFMHHRGVIHGDLKPSNMIFMDQDRNTRIIDFDYSLRIGIGKCPTLFYSHLSTDLGCDQMAGTSSQERMAFVPQRRETKRTRSHPK